MQVQVTQAGTHIQPKIQSAFGYQFDNLSGIRFGRVIVSKFSHEPIVYRRFWSCACDCGKQRTMREDWFKPGDVTCADCIRIEIKNSKKPRTCPCCEIEKPRSDFCKDIHTTDELARYCKVCQRRKATAARGKLMRRKPEDILVPEEQCCSTCRITKPSSEFYYSRGEPKGLSRKCSDCANIVHRRWYAEKGRERRLPIARASRYGLSNSQVEEKVISQGSKCSICEKPFTHRRSFVIDHDHATGKLRGMLCPGCNTALGLLKDNVHLCESAIRYLKHWAHVI